MQERIDQLERARAIPLSGGVSITFKLLVLQRNWYAVRTLARLQTLTAADKCYLSHLAERDGVALFFDA